MPAMNHGPGAPYRPSRRLMTRWCRSKLFTPTGFLPLWPPRDGKRRWWGPLGKVREIIDVGGTCWSSKREPEKLMRFVWWVKWYRNSLAHAFFFHLIWILVSFMMWIVCLCWCWKTLFADFKDSIWFAGAACFKMKLWNHGMWYAFLKHKVTQLIVSLLCNVI